MQEWHTLRSTYYKGQFRFTCRTSNCIRKWAFFYRWGAIPQRGNSCDTCWVLWYDVFHESGNTHEGKEVDEYSCLSRTRRKNLSTDISKLVMRLVRHYDQDEREPDGADHGNSIHPKLLWASEFEDHENFLTRIGYAAFRKVAARQGSSTVQIQRIPYCTLVQFRHTHLWTHRTRIDESRWNLPLQGNFSKKEIEHYSKDSQHLDLHQGYLSEADGNRSSSHSPPQPQQLSSESASTGTGKLVRSPSVMMEERENLVDVTDAQCPTGTWKLVRATEHSVQKQPEFENDLRPVGVRQDAIFEDEVQMKEINEKLVKLKSGSCPKSIRDDLKDDNLTFGEESSRVIYEMGNMELIELRRTTDTVQSHSCLSHVPTGLKFCQCGVCLRPDEETISRIRATFQALTAPYYVAASESLKEQEARRTKNGKTTIGKQWVAKRGAKKHHYASILERWQGDQINRDAQLKINWTDFCCRYFDYLTTIDNGPEAPYHQRNRYENTITMSCNCPILQSGPMKNRSGYRAATTALRTLRDEQGRTNLIHSPKKIMSATTQYASSKNPGVSKLAQRKLANSHRNYRELIIRLTQPNATHKRQTQPNTTNNNPKQRKTTQNNLEQMKTNYNTQKQFWTIFRITLRHLKST